MCHNPGTRQIFIPLDNRSDVCRTFFLSLSARRRFSWKTLCLAFRCQSQVSTITRLTSPGRCIFIVEAPCQTRSERVAAQHPSAGNLDRLRLQNLWFVVRTQWYRFYGIIRDLDREAQTQNCLSFLTANWFLKLRTFQTGRSEH